MRLGIVLAFAVLAALLVAVPGMLLVDAASQQQQAQLDRNTDLLARVLREQLNQRFDSVRQDTRELCAHDVRVERLSLELAAGNESVDDLVPMGVVGVIPTKVTGENGPIRRGDLLVTSSTPGHAMKADREKVEIGMVIGKALEDFDGSGNGLIKVLVNVK